ncbi:ribosomal protein L35a [Hamiltosporidium tvaerminnensis]|uniref:Ribosomal protein L35a n=2 Tax=Hamiltosporidium TaxID=1176354 RepID=A0A4Q9L8R3_9MICR|nr:60S ribosomal protein L35A [Hamiltosporidium tvaerminnensis]TBU04088.1 ribosomal protein L35a [Hamiltosporidium magnivora]TBT99718.1 ribosomal protein L35a [Hamiltosporidium tvaerminnensis]TBU04822.1 ribosomal protein L35a [Hamiltosporidium magnivora]TBU12401.1 ribosomal protein L35a [Hamiltosporidium tvaerminnensis]
MQAVTREYDALHRTCVPATFFSYKRSLRKIYPKYALLRLPCVNTREQASKYVGHAVVSMCKGIENKGRISKVHGNSGVVVCRFKKNLAPRDIGSEVFVRLYKVEENEVFND